MSQTAEFNHPYVATGASTERQDKGEDDMNIPRVCGAGNVPGQGRSGSRFA